MRVLLLNQFYPPDVAATGQLLGDLAEGLARRGHEVHVLSSRRAYGGGGRIFPSETRRGGLYIHRVSATGFGRAGLVGRAIDYLSFYVLAMRRAMQLPRMDVCVSLTTPPFIALVGMLLGRRRGTKLVLWTMDLYPDIAVALGVLSAGGWLHRATTWLSRRVYQAAAKIITLGDVMAGAVTRAGVAPEKVAIVHNWVPGERVEYIPPAGSRTVRLLYSGNLGMGHELDTAIRAIADLPQKSRENLQVRFVGYGKLRPHLQSLAEELGLKCVEFLPPCPLDRLSENLAWGDVHLVSQRVGTEGLIVPSKLYGILAAGRATVYIGPDDTEVAKILRDHRAGVLVPPGDVAATAGAMKELFADVDRRRVMGDAARKAYEMHFGRDRSVTRLADAIESVV